MKVLIGSFQQESNSFSPIQCGLDMFKQKRLIYGEDVIHCYENTPTQMGAFLTVLRREKAEIIPSISAQSVSSGPVTEEAYQEVESTLVRDLKAHWPVDGVLLCLHGATILTEYYDGAGRLLERIRQEVGDKVIAGTLDLHANITEKMIKSADVLIGYHTYPHVDQYQVGYDAAGILVEAVKGRKKPVMAMVKLPMIHQAEACRTDRYPFNRIMEKVREIEARENILSASVFQMQPWMDLEDAGAAVIVIADGDEGAARFYAETLAKEYWGYKDEIVFELTPLGKAVERAVKIAEGPVVISESADAPSAGAPGDSNAVLRYMINNNVDIETMLTMVDPESVQHAIKTGVGNEAEFFLGGKISKNEPVKIKGRVKVISDGEFAFGSPAKGKGGQESHVMHSMGRTAVIKTGKISILVMENPMSVKRPSMFRSVGLEPGDAKLVVIKAALQESFEDIAKEIYVVDTPGSSSANLKAMPYKNLRKPMYPFDEMPSYDTAKTMVVGRSCRKQ